MPNHKEPFLYIKIILYAGISIICSWLKPLIIAFAFTVSRFLKPQSLFRFFNNLSNNFLLSHVCLRLILKGPYNKRNFSSLSILPDSLNNDSVHCHGAIWTMFIDIIPCRESRTLDGICQGVSLTSILKGSGILLFNLSWLIHELILFLYPNSGSLICHNISGNLFWNSIPYSPLPLPISKMKPFLKGFLIKHPQYIFYFFEW